jgi:hypothetical protein
MPVADAGSDSTAPVDASPLPVDATASAGTKPLAYGCSANAECASGFCVDGVCCDAACDQQCTACNIAGAAGHCAGQLSGDDTQAAVACTGARTCGFDLTSPTGTGAWSNGTPRWRPGSSRRVPRPGCSRGWPRPDVAGPAK